MAANTAHLDAPPDRLTFGVELEFLVPWLYDDQNDPLGQANGLSPLFRVSRNTTDADIEIRDTLRNLFWTHGLETSVQTYKYKSEYAKGTLDRYSAWNITGDPSVIEEDPSFLKYQWTDVEITSPVEPDIPIAYEILNYARQLLTKSYRCRVNSSCGLHVHVGKGAERFDLTNMRRIAALIWSSEHLVANLNHPSRQSNFMLPTLRTRSVIALGRSDGTHDKIVPGAQLSRCMDYLAKEVRHGEDPFSFRDRNRGEDIRAAFAKTRENGHYEPFQWSPNGQSNDAFIPIEKNQKSVDEEILESAEKMASQPNFQRSVKPKEPSRIRTLAKMVNKKHTYIDPLNPDVKEDPGVFEGVKQLYESPSSCDLAWLMYPKGRGSVNFSLYNCGEFCWADRGKRTIEFRVAEGTLDSWVVTWTKICVGMIRFALYSPVDEFLSVLMKCDASDREGGNFDCIDFLDEIGLPAEAVLAERHLKENEKEFGIKYVNGSS
ncbi:uncharacterized protein GGS22DRAFT_148712 [Annulohypoxylon maeteangense]|uniref:uncharacterized protein n=1 Tax=Annulohypoxylon maeteangense TaxID=1927788 RepID=UPI0020072D13|nr:uncharacterized protein GGS22DRAFT_148712 [Annulohypoxylon maeteangense]KAI0889606.1 hypothetical protein GGS22DRAFT_148712 [Annulohypoxylon maeteangense]